MMAVLSCRLGYVFFFCFSVRKRHTSVALVTGVQTCALPIYVLSNTGIPCALAGVAAARLPIDPAAKKSCFIVSLLSAWAPAPVKFRQPELRIIAQFGNHFASHARCLSAPRQQGPFIVHEIGRAHV